MLRILLLERKGSHATALQKLFKAISQPARIVAASTLAQARQSLDQESVEVILSDLRLADGMGTELITMAGEPLAVPVVILLTAPDALMTVEVMRAGAMDVVVKGEETLRELPLTVTRALRGWHHITRRRAAEKALEQNEIKYRSLFESMRSAVAVYQPVEDGRDFLLVDFNKAAERLNRIGKESVLGRRVTEVFPGVREFGLLDVLRRVHQTGRAERYPLTTYKDHHLEYWVENHVYRLPGGEVVAVHDDLTNGKIAERILNDKATQFQSVLDNAPVIIYIKDMQGKFRFVNRLFEAQAQRSREEILGKSGAESLPDALARQQELQEARMIASQETVESEHSWTLNDDMHTTLLLTFPLQDSDGQMQGICGIAKDISERKRIEAQISQLNATLEERVRERTAQLNHSLESLRRTQRQLVESEKMASLGNLVAGVAHEINTPLGVSYTAASYLQDLLREHMNATHGTAPLETVCDQRLTAINNAVEILMKNLNRAAHLVQSFKQVAVDRCVTQRRRIHLRSFITEVLSSLRPKLDESAHRLCFACPEETEATVYPGAIAQIITNLVSNSLLHAFELKPHGTIWITVIPTDRQIHIKYRDNGRGMTAEQVHQIFEPFFTTRRGQGGAGLGMHIVYNLVTQTLGGDIFCHSAPDRGIDFSILFPT
ncbi:MAG: PAS domain-containing protein [Magnetococcales bacterium]|nr:PAS domain-containing protein [Magnetococcales bacterium]